MAETEPTNPIDLVPDNFELPSFDALSPEQQEAITSGPGWVTDPAEIRTFPDVETFRYQDNPDTGPEGRGAGNFPAFAMQKGEIWKIVANNMPAYQRFTILFPGALEGLSEDMQEFPNSQLPDSIWRALFKTYNVMSRLVDTSDEDVTGNPADDRYYLIK